jgi:hypothetical protein
MAALLRWAEVAWAGLLLWSCFRPWLFVMGAPVAGHHIRRQLEGPHRFASLFTTRSRVSLDYSLAVWLRVLPYAAAGVLLAVLWRAARRSPLVGALQPWASILCGTGALAAFLFLRSEAAAWPFVHMAYGARLAAVAGAALAASALLRIALPR